MSSQEKKVLVNTLGTIIIFTLYCFYVNHMFQQGLEQNLKHWGLVLLIFIPVAIISKIIIYILFYIVNAVVTREEMEDITDERDKIIELKANSIGYIVVGVGFMLSMVTLVLEMPVYVMFNLWFFSFNLADIISDFAKIRYYRRGF
jgi:hypothetical protein